MKWQKKSKDVQNNLYVTEFIKLTASVRKLLLLLLHTYFMVQSPSWEANWFAASQEIPRI